MKNLLRKIRNFKLIRETKGEVVLAAMAIVALLGITGAVYNSISHQHEVTTINITITDTPAAIEDGTSIVIVVNPENGPTIGEVSTGSPDPTLVNELNKEMVLQDNYTEEDMDKASDELTKNFMKYFNANSDENVQYKYTEEEMDKASDEFSKNFIEYINANSDKNMQNQGEENESNKISDKNTKQQLAQNQLPDDKLSIDIYNSIKNLVSENIKSDQLDDIGNISTQLLKDLFSKGEGTSNSEEDIIKSIKDDLNKKKLLAEEDVVSKRKYLKLLQQTKEEYEQRVAVIDKLGPESVWTQNLIDYKNDKRIIDDLNMKISEADDFINNYETEIAGETADQSTTTPETEQTTTISSDTLTTLQSTTSSTDLATTTIGSTTTTSGSTTTTSGSTTTTAGSTSTTENSELPEYISLYGSIGGYSNSMNLTINLKTGNVSGGINLVYTQTETIGDSTKTCSYSVKGSISGQMDLETRQISGSFSGSATALTEGCYGKDLSYSISGKLNENYSAANGSASNGWSWSVYK